MLECVVPPGKYPGGFALEVMMSKQQLSDLAVHTVQCWECQFNNENAWVTATVSVRIADMEVPMCERCSRVWEFSRTSVFKEEK
jgi:hypothetical protein